MKRSYIIIILFLIINCSSKNRVETVMLSMQYSINDLIEVRLNLYEINSSIYPILDSVIERVTCCPKYKNDQIAFVFSTCKDTLNRFIINIENTSGLHFFDYTICNGVFYYKGYQFVHIGTINNSLLKDLKKDVKLFCINKKKLLTMYQGNNEFYYSSWDFIYENEQYKCIHYRDCENFWNNSDYPPIPCY